VQQGRLRCLAPVKTAALLDSLDVVSDAPVSRADACRAVKFVKPGVHFREGLAKAFGSDAAMFLVGGHGVLSTLALIITKPFVLISKWIILPY